MGHHVGPLILKHLRELRAADVHLIAHHARGRVVPAPPEQHVDHRDVVARVAVGLGHMRADKSGPPGHEDSHSTVTLFARLRG